jgi:hypothetical protein
VGLAESRKRTTVDRFDLEAGMSSAISLNEPVVICRQCASQVPVRRNIVALKWQDQPDEHDSAAAADHLGLPAGKDHVEALLACLRSAPLTHNTAKDILRAARLPLLAANDPEVRLDVAKATAGIPLSRVLPIRGDRHARVPAQIADGHHRVCGSHHTHEDTHIPARADAH